MCPFPYRFDGYVVFPTRNIFSKVSYVFIITYTHPNPFTATRTIRKFAPSLPPLPKNFPCRCSINKPRAQLLHSRAGNQLFFGKMVMYEVHRHPVLQKYKTHICSRATLFQFFVVVLTFIPPLIIAYVTHGEFRKSWTRVLMRNTNSLIFSNVVCFFLLTGFWLKESIYREQPDVRFKHEFVFIAQGNMQSSYLAYSTFQNFNQLLQKNLRIPLVKVSSYRDRVLQGGLAIKQSCVSIQQSLDKCRSTAVLYYVQGIFSWKIENRLWSGILKLLKLLVEPFP